MMQKAIVENGATKYVDLTPAEEAEVLARVKAGEEAAALEARKAAAVQAARAQVAAADKTLAIALGFIEPDVGVTEKRVVNLRL